MRPSRYSPLLVLAGAFLGLLALYWPARDAGWVSDTLGWLDAVRTQSFGDFISRSGFGVRSLYQTTQIATWSLFRVFGANRLAWHLLHVALQALNAALLFAFFRGLIRDSRLTDTRPALLAVVLFCLSPYLSEVLVWEAAFHYLQGLLFIGVQLLLLQAFIRRDALRYPVVAALLFIAASFSLELFYLTPAFSVLVLLYYRFGAPQIHRERIRRASRRFLLPQLIILALHLALIRVVYGTHTGRLGDSLWEQPLSYFAIKPPDYVLHLAGGRFLPQQFRDAWHRFFCTYGGAALFYAMLAASLSYLIFRFRRMSAVGQLSGWAWCATLCAMAIVTPMWFPERLLVMGDRYLYLMLPFFLFMISLLLFRITFPVVRGIACVLLCIVSACGAGWLAQLWHRSESITRRMQERFPRFPAGTQVLLLNNPANLQGIPMTGAGADGEFALMRRLLYCRDEPAAIEESFAPEYRGEVPPVELRPAASGCYRVRLDDPAGRWWYGPDYAARRQTAAWSARMLDQQSYALCLNPAVPRVLLLWNGRRFVRFRQVAAGS